jgi:hypothetical protein
VVELLFHPGIVAAVSVAAIASLTVLRLTRDQIQLTKTLPMLKRVPGIQRLAG